MASRLIHLAITNELAKRYELNHIDRLRFGTIIPDGAMNRQESLRAHFKMKIGDKGERSYNLTEYRTRFAALLREDSLYVGYYLHLIQDLLYRHFVYDLYHWDSRPAGNIERLHDDYRQINPYVIHNYNLTDDICLPAAFEKEPMSQIAVFDPVSFLEEFKRDFEPVEYKKRFFFTDRMADEYIRWATEYCGKELEALRRGTFFFDEYRWSWGR